MPHKITLEIELSAPASVRAPINPEVARALADDVGAFLLASPAHPSWCAPGGWRVTAVSPVPWVPPRDSFFTRRKGSEAREHIDRMEGR